MRGVCFCEKAHFSFFIYPHVVLRNSTPFSQWHNHFTGDQHPIMLMQPFDDTSAPAVTHKKETQAPLSQRHACASHHREILKLNRNAFLCIGQTFFAHSYNLFYNYN